MKSFRLLAAMAIGIMWLNFPALASTESGNIEVKVSGLKNNDGVVRIALYDDSARYKGDNKENSSAGAYRKTTAVIKGGIASCAFEQIPDGRYAIKFFHDENNSGQFITGMFGIPKVEYGFSNNARAAFGPPSFEKAAFKFTGAEAVLNLTAH